MGTRTDSNKLFRRVAAMALGAALVVVGGCAEQSEDMGPAAAVSITWGEFDPIAVTVQAGQEVIWRNNPVSVQSVTAVAIRHDRTGRHLYQHVHCAGDVSIHGRSRYTGRDRHRRALRFPASSRCVVPGRGPHR